MRKSLYALLVAPLFFAACNKGSDSPGNEFIINGVHDVSFGTAGSNVLSVAVAQSSGTQQPVTITVTGLPTGVSADIQPASGTPSFASAITFSQTGLTTAGTYPIHITGTSSSYAKTYDLNLTIPVLNGFVVSGTTYTRSSLMHSTNSFPPYVFSTILISSFDNGGAYLQGNISAALPTADGTYTYHVGGSAANAIGLDFDANNSSVSYSSDYGSDTTKTATLIVANGKYTLRANNIVLYNSSGSDMKTLTINASE